MIPACDFCSARGDDPGDGLFAESPCGKFHICDGCVDTAVGLLSRKRLADRKAACARGDAVP